MCAYLGPTVTSECVLPCVENALYDVEERVVVSALKGIVKVVRMKLLSRLLIVEFSEKCKPLLLHPLYSLRQAAVDFFEAAAEIIGIIDTAVFLIPIIRDTLSYDLSGVSLSGEVIRLALLRNISRKVYHNALMEQLKAISDTTFKFYCNEKRIRQQLQMIDTDFNDQFQSLDQARHSLSPNSSNLACELSTKLKVELMKDYINHSAREINTKTRQWRMFKEFSNNIYHDKLVVEEISTVVSTSKGVLPNLSLSWNYRHMPDYSLQSLLVPHQKFGVSHFPGVSESARRQKMTFEADGYRNILKLRGIYGITGSQADAARALAAGVGDVWDQPQASFDDRSVNSGQQSPLSVTNLQTSETVVTPGVAITSAVVLAENSPRLSSSPSTPIPASRDADTKHTGKLPEYPIVKLRIMNPAFAESLLLWKRICALHIPPLPPDLGTLSQPNGKKYRYYF